MRARQPLPRVWMMTDERQRDVLAAVRRLPRGAGVVFRHYRLKLDARRRLFDRVRAEARRRGAVLLLAGNPRDAIAWGANGFHGRRRGSGLRTAPVHSLREIVIAQRSGAGLLFVSPVYPTRSHPGTRVLGPVMALLLARRARVPVVGLGGMTAARGRALMRAGLYGWAAIDAWS